MGAGTDSDRSASPSVASEDFDNGQRALDSPSESSEHGPFNDTETMSEEPSTPEASSACSTPCAVMINVGTPSASRGEHGEDDMEVVTCISTGVNVSPMSRSTTRPPPPCYLFLGLPSPLDFSSPPQPPNSTPHPTNANTCPTPCPRGRSKWVLAGRGIHGPGRRNPYLSPAHAHTNHQAPRQTVRTCRATFCR